MKRKPDHSERRSFLRKEAELMVARFYPPESLLQTSEKLLHELMVHKIELELQNEELRITCAALEEVRDHYLELYEFAPVGYVTLNDHGLIKEANLVSCSLLGIQRSKLINQHFSKFIAPQNADDWHHIFLNLIEGSSDKNEFSLEMMDSNRSFFSAHIVCYSKKPMADNVILRIAFTFINHCQFPKHG